MERMLAGNSWLAMVSTLAAPGTVIAIHFWRLRRDPGALTAALQKAQTQQALTLEKQPRHWSQSLAAATLLALPLSQFLAYWAFRTPLAFFLPLAAGAPILLWVGMFRPGAEFLRPPEHREWAINSGLLAAGLGVALAMPATGGALVLRGALMDGLALLLLSYAARVYRSRQRSVVGP